ncbi:hypothetical protein ACHAP3_008953 [Botrytis cinerea]|uniref:Uncharacterized protein n=2 Tax=Botryotinia fuckeliana TaxID=40559 RepID=G2YWN8_BOTF4|nr:hypothetical protein BcDW1_10397 [Botrytis cinerea BcDW1]CCD56036.1 hypothetical protein BofuT4_P151680.1 [Botrytis cinerea T4]
MRGHYNPIRALNTHPCRSLPPVQPRSRVIQPRHLDSSPTITLQTKISEWWAKKIKGEKMTLGKKIPVALAVGGVIGVVVDEKIREKLLRRGKGGKGGDGDGGDLGGMPALVMGPRNKTWQDDIVFQFEDAVGFI